jgi:hypothetical protein
VLSASPRQERDAKVSERGYNAIDIARQQLDLLKSDIEHTGFACLEKPFDDALFESLRDEASVQRASARHACDDGDISYRGYLASLGEVAKASLTGQMITGLLQSIFDQRFVLTCGSSCYTYYEAGDFLSAHRDSADDCEVTLLVYLDVASPDPDAADSGLYLRINRDDGGRPGPEIRTIRTRSNTLVVGRGSKMWHARPALRDGERVSLLTACFSATPE